MMELVKGRPQNCEGRLEKEVRVYEQLDALGIEYYRVDHEAAFTMEACSEIDLILGALICKNLFLCNRQKTEFYLLMMPGDKPFKTKILGQQLGTTRLSFADPEYMEAFLDITPGALSVLGLMNDKEYHVQLVMDKTVYESDEFGCHPCVNTSSVKMRTKELLEKFLPAIKHDVRVVDLPWFVE